MTVDRIYHYTSIDSLALILKTQNLRFTRLDGVDDIREAQRHAEIDFGKYFFVSCWTTQFEESIPQWSMYSREMQGIRLELPNYPFADKLLSPKPGWEGIKWQGNLLSPITFEEMSGASYFIVPMFLNREHFAAPVEYVQNVDDFYARSIKREVSRDGKVILNIKNFPQLPRRKSTSWSFQKEYRFALFVLPSLHSLSDGTSVACSSEKFMTYMSDSFINNVDPGVKHIDVPLAPLAFQDLVVRTGPLTTPGGQICVEALVNHFAPCARIEQSALSGAIRVRGQ